jgi:osmotically-inducible protein OsmY
MKSDAQLKQDVLSELEWEPSVNAAQIGVEVKDGIVTLAGQVDSCAEKWDAEKATQRVSGVKALTIEIVVKLTGSSKRSDVDIARSAQGILDWTSFLPKDAIKVMVENGWVTLSGQVKWDYQRQGAANAVRCLLGVNGVSNDIDFNPTVSLHAVKSDVEAALKRRAQVDSEAISVEVHGSDVTLSGTVHSWSERELATHAAWGTPGVHKVTDNIKLAY